ncbi:MAG TPA: M64 family metallopeptidase, partial [Chitinophagales bacterium]|nr:M64 family metallopeptidase [Chitinophagales bacterium]
YCPNTTAINEVLKANTPWFDKALIVVNTPHYGGSGGNYSIGSVHPSSAEIMIHEFGHSFAGLADEYGGSYCNGLEKPNVTRETNRDLIKWRKRIKASTPVPTPANTLCSETGLYNGGNYCTSGWYRPACNCKMRTLNQPLCDVCKDEFVLRILSYPVHPDSIKGGTTQPPVAKPIVKVNGLDTYTTTITAPDTVRLTATGAASYKWSTGETTASVTKAPAAQTVYGVIGTTNGMSDTAYANVYVKAAPVNTDPCRFAIEPIVWQAQSCTLRIQTTKAFADFEFCHNVQKVPNAYDASGNLLYSAWLCQTVTSWTGNYRNVEDYDPNTLTVVVTLRWPHAMYKQQVRVRGKGCALSTAKTISTP